MSAQTSNSAELFFERYGGVCVSDGTFNYSETLAALNEFVPFPVYAVRNDRFNAIAVTKGSARFIGIFSGLLKACHSEIFDVLSSDRIQGLLPKNLEAGDERWAESWRTAGFDTPTSTCAWFLSYCMILYVLFHEAAHLSCGHHRIIENHTGVYEYVEFPILDLPEELAELRRALELDADHIASSSSLLLWRDMCNTFRQRTLFEVFSPDELWLTAVTIFFCLAQRRGSPALDRKLASHPSSSARLTSSIVHVTIDPLVDEKFVLNVRDKPLFLETIRHFQSVDGYTVLGQGNGPQIGQELDEINKTMKRLEEDLDRQRTRFRAEMASNQTGFDSSGSLA